MCFMPDKFAIVAKGHREYSLRFTKRVNALLLLVLCYTIYLLSQTEQKKGINKNCLSFKKQLCQGEDVDMSIILFNIVM